ncbi:hypothetical protein OSB04_030907 [Centaurea solstitialis]|uniref:Uncharacterized protein n=1 Tax=Centaurea solstitialis TaxID=347529 RepID=A0AA38W5G4_9ASTR|nr:hypothetical protein OSB04_030907 [Centaurea solstitialis]
MTIVRYMVIVNMEGGIYKSKFEETVQGIPRFWSNYLLKISDNQKVELELPFSKEEVRSAVRSCGINKEPRLDDFTFAFISNFKGLIEADVNETLNDYRLIHLMGIVYKVISKVLAERLKSVMDSLISKE